jgi:hypothetical protein
MLAAAVLPAMVPRMIGLDPVARVVAAILVVAPVGFLMGIPFPLGLRAFAAGDSGRVGWAWSANGAASGVAGVLAAMIAIDLGLTVLMAAGGLTYLAAWLALRRNSSPRPSESM